MRFEWSAKKNAENIRKHGLNFSDAARMFSGTSPLLVEPDVREYYREERWIGLGRIGTKIAVVVFTHDASTNTIRIISLREADTDEQNGYYTQIL